MRRVRGASGDGLWRRVAGVMGVAGESRASRRRDWSSDVCSSDLMGSGGGVLSLASEAYSLAWLKASQRYLALGELGNVCM